MVGSTKLAVATQDRPEEREEQGLRRIFVGYQHFVLTTLLALAFFGAMSVSAPREALAAGTGYYPTLKSDGQYYQCWWVYYGNDVWREDGCVLYYGKQPTAYYYSYSQQRHYVDYRGQWYPLGGYWRDSNVASTIDYYSNRPGFDIYSRKIADHTAHLWFASRSMRTSEASRSPEISDGSSFQPPQSLPPQEDSTTLDGASNQRASASAFPWKVCQDDRDCFTYNGSAWKQVKTNRAQGGSYRVSSSKSRGAFFAATGPTDAGGSNMKLITATGPSMGKAKVIVVNLSNATVVKRVTFDLRTSKPNYRVAKSIKGLTPHRPYGLIVLSADGRPVAVDAVGYEAHGSMCHNVV